VIGEGIKVDDSKIEAILTWLLPKSIHDVQHFHGLASFYRWFIKDLSTIMSPMTEVSKVSSFKWSSKAQAAFEEEKDKVTVTPRFFKLRVKNSGR